MITLTAPEIEQRVAHFLEESFPELDELKRRAITLSFAASLTSSNEPPEDLARRYRESAAFLDRALVGVSDDTKRDVLRVMMNLGVRPDDEFNVLFAVYGYFASMAEKVPAQMKAVVGELERNETRFLDDIILLRETGEKLVSKITAELETQAVQIGSTAVKSAVASEYEALRYQVGVIARDAFATLSESLKKNGGPQTVGSQGTRAQIITAGAIIIALLVGAFIAPRFSAPAQHTLTSQDATRLREGATYERIWGDQSMPPNVRAWLEAWAKTH